MQSTFREKRSSTGQISQKERAIIARLHIRSMVESMSALCTLASVLLCKLIATVMNGNVELINSSFHGGRDLLEVFVLLCF